MYDVSTIGILVCHCIHDYNMVISLIAMPALQVASLLQSMRNKNKIFVTFASCIIQLYNFPEERKLTMLLFGFRLCILRSNDNATLHTDTAKKLQNVQP